MYTCHVALYHAKVTLTLLVADHDDVDFAKPVGIPKASQKRVGSAPSGSGGGGGAMSRKTSFGVKTTGGE